MTLEATAHSQTCKAALVPHNERTGHGKPAQQHHRNRQVAIPAVTRRAGQSDVTVQTAKCGGLAHGYGSGHDAAASCVGDSVGTHLERGDGATGKE